MEKGSFVTKITEYFPQHDSLKAENFESPLNACRSLPNAKPPVQSTSVGIQSPFLPLPLSYTSKLWPLLSFYICPFVCDMFFLWKRLGSFFFFLSILQFYKVVYRSRYFIHLAHMLLSEWVLLILRFMFLYEFLLFLSLKFFFMNLLVIEPFTLMLYIIYFSNIFIFVVFCTIFETFYHRLSV